MKDRFHGIGRAYGMQAINTLAESSVMVVGIGGVGSWAAEALARTGVGHIILVDLDDICVSNINRQIHALSSTVGHFKVDAMAKRLEDINPNIKLTNITSFLSHKNLDSLLEMLPTAIVDCTDDVTNKCLLAARCRDKQQLLLTVGASGGRRDPSFVRTSDLSTTRNDRLLYRIRKILRSDYNFPKENEGDFGIPCIYSAERPVYPTNDGCLSHEPLEPGKGMDCETGYGSVSFVTGTFGFHIAAETVKQILKKKNQYLL
jgi:tRNA threonylcarbamoyladenosine dehydratase